MILNIGLNNAPLGDASYTNGVPNPHLVRKVLNAVQALRRLGFTGLHAQVHMSDSEPTLVVECTGPQYAGAMIRELAAQLNQEVIAVYGEARVGVMVGASRALDTAWGEFNPKLFVMPDGSRLQP